MSISTCPSAFFATPVSRKSHHAEDHNVTLSPYPSAFFATQVSGNSHHDEDHNVTVSPCSSAVFATPVQCLKTVTNQRMTKSPSPCPTAGPAVSASPVSSLSHHVVDHDVTALVKEQGWCWGGLRAELASSPVKGTPATNPPPSP